MSKLGNRDRALDQFGETGNKLPNVARELCENWNNRLVFPLSEFPERYVRGDLGILLHCSPGGGDLGCGDLGCGKFSLLVQHDFRGNIGKIRRDADQGDGTHNCKFPMLIESIHIVDDREKMIRSIGPNVVWLKKLDESRTSSSIIGKVPDDVVKAGPEMVDNLSGEHTKSQRNLSSLMVVKRLLPELIIWMGDNWILPTLKENCDLAIEIDDVLVGPF